MCSICKICMVLLCKIDALIINYIVLDILPPKGCNGSVLYFAFYCTVLIQHCGSSRNWSMSCRLGKTLASLQDLILGGYFHRYYYYYLINA